MRNLLLLLLGNIALAVFDVGSHSAVDACQLF